jgi:pimeloyl-ACP methyl ester carboxylesterase
MLSDVNGLVDIGGGRMIYVRCTGAGSPTVILEGGDEDTSASYAFAVPSLAENTRTCVYDRANLGASDPDPGPRGLPELVADLENVISATDIPGPYVLVGTSGGGYITAGYAVAHPLRRLPPQSSPRNAAECAPTSRTNGAGSSSARKPGNW